MPTTGPSEAAGAESEQAKFYATMGDFMKKMNDTNDAVLAMLEDQREANATAAETQAKLVEENRELSQKSHKAQLAAVNEAKSARDAAVNIITGNSVTTRSGSGSTPAVIAATSTGERLKMPPLWEGDEEIWFTKLETEMEICVPRITTDSQKYRTLTSLLPKKYAKEAISTIRKLDRDPTADDKYDQLKRKIIKLYAISPAQKRTAFWAAFGKGKGTNHTKLRRRTCST